MSTRAFVATLGVLAFIALLFFGLQSKGADDVAIGDPAPEAELPRLDGSGSASLADYRGQWVLVNFWASWCNPCRTESPDLQRYHDEHASEEFTVLGINQNDLTGDANEFIEEFELTYPHLRDGEGEQADPFGMTGLPETFLVDPEGKLALIRRGPVDTKYLEEFVTPLITRATRKEKGTAS